MPPKKQSKAKPTKPKAAASRAKPNTVPPPTSGPAAARAKPVETVYKLQTPGKLPPSVLLQNQKGKTQEYVSVEQLGKVNAPSVYEDPKSLGKVNAPSKAEMREMRARNANKAQAPGAPKILPPGSKGGKGGKGGKK